jgi:hypothetical protein
MFMPPDCMAKKNFPHQKLVWPDVKHLRVEIKPVNWLCGAVKAREEREEGRGEEWLARTRKGLAVGGVEEERGTRFSDGDAGGAA